MKEVMFSLPGTMTYKNRSATWHRYTKAGFPVWGVVTIHESRNIATKVKTSKYVVQELKPDAGGRRFRLYPTTHQDSEFSFVLLTQSARLNQCTCKGFTSGNRCKHITTLEVLQLRKLLPPIRRRSKPKPADLKRGR